MDDVYLTPGVNFSEVLLAGTDRAGLSAGPGHGVGPGVIVRRHLPGPGLVTAWAACGLVTGQAGQAGGGRHPGQQQLGVRGAGNTGASWRQSLLHREAVRLRHRGIEKQGKEIKRDLPLVCSPSRDLRECRDDRALESC